MKHARPLVSASPLSGRLAKLAPITDTELAAISSAEREQRRWPHRREIMAEGEPIREKRAILSGWACRQKILADGRRQILSFLLPGDLLGNCRHPRPIASTTILAVTDVVTSPVPEPRSPADRLAEAFAISAALEEHYLLAQVARLGRLSAPERLADWLLETYERLALVDLASGDQLPMPLTQEFLADTLGLTSVHVNRTLQAMRRDGLIASTAGAILLTDRAKLEEMVDYKPARVTA